MIYRIAEESDWTSLAEAWKVCTDNPLPQKGIVEVSIAEDNGKVVAFMCAQSIVDVGQLGIIPEYRKSSFGDAAGTVDRSKLLQPLDDLIRSTGASGYISMATKNRDERFTWLGYTLPAWLLYRRIF